MAPGKEFINYRIFENEEIARTVLLDLLESNGIPYEGVLLQKNSDHHLSAVFLKSGYAVSLRLEDFGKVEKLMDEAAQDELKNLDESHYLYQFTIEELKEVIEKPYDWNRNDYAIALKLLNDVGHKITAAEIEAYKKKHYKEMATPKALTNFQLFRKYLQAIAGGVLTVIEGRHLYKSTIVLPDGKVFYEYDKRTRAHGVLIYWMGIVITFTWITCLVIYVITQ